MKQKLTKIFNKLVPIRWISSINSLLILDYSPIILPWFKFKDGKESIDYIHRLALRIKTNKLNLSSKKTALFIIARPIAVFVQAFLSVYRYGRIIGKQHYINYFKQWQQIIYLAILHNITPESYYKFRLWNDINRKKAALYIQHHEIVVLLPWLNKNSDVNRFKDKTIFYETCVAYGIPTAPIIAAFSKSNGVKWFCDNEIFPARDLFIKNSELWRGIGAEKWKYIADGEYWERKDKKLNQRDLLQYCCLRSKEIPLIVQPFLENHPKIECFSNGSLCTLRIVTCRLPAQKPMLLIASFRMPVGNAEVDSFVAGGIAAGVSATGTLGLAVSFAVSQNLNQGNFTHHPNTQSRIEGEQLPFWQDMLNLALLAHECFSDPFFIAWDIALTAEGAILVEGNTTWGVEVLQIPHNKPLGETPFLDIFNTVSKP